MLLSKILDLEQFIQKTFCHETRLFDNERFVFPKCFAYASPDAPSYHPIMQLPKNKLS